jgi:hypothetical protein
MMLRRPVTAFACHPDVVTVDRERRHPTRPVIQRLDVLAVEESQHSLLQLARSLAGDDLHQGRLLRHRFIDDGA